MTRRTVLAISGSLRAKSTNTTLLLAAALVTGPDIAIEMYDGLDRLPHFNPDIQEAGVPPDVADLRARVARADALLISSPEYARGIPGSLKNALDWLVGGNEMPGKRVALFNASARAEHAPAQLKTILQTIAAEFVDHACITVPLLGRDIEPTEVAANPEFANRIRAGLAALLGTRD